MTSVIRRPLAFLIGLVLALCVDRLDGAVAQASRFGPPWQAEVVAERTLARGAPDAAAAPVGPLRKGDILVVLEEKGEWTRTPVGFVATADIGEKFDAWIGEVTAATVELHAKPNASSDVRRTARAGALLRVLGASPGLDGDSGTWWATTEGYLRLDEVKKANVEAEWVRGWALPRAEDATKGWWGKLSGEANVRAGASTEAPIVGEFAGGERVKVLAEEDGEEVAGSNKWLRIDGGRFAGARVHSSRVERIEQVKPGAAPPAMEGDRAVIVVDRSTRILTLFRDGQPRFATYVALGKAGKDTPAGEYSTYGKFRADDMTSSSVADAERPYDLPNTPFVQYYKEGGFALHGTYWHDAFGTEESQGCINMTWADAAYLFGETTPEVADDRNHSWSGEQEATRVVITD